MAPLIHHHPALCCMYNSNVSWVAWGRAHVLKNAFLVYLIFNYTSWYKTHGCINVNYIYKCIKTKEEKIWTVILQLSTVTTGCFKSSVKHRLSSSWCSFFSAYRLVLDWMNPWLKGRQCAFRRNNTFLLFQLGSHIRSLRLYLVQCDPWLMLADVLRMVCVPETVTLFKINQCRGKK